MVNDRDQVFVGIYRQFKSSNEFSIDQLEYDLATSGIRLDIVSEMLARFHWWRKASFTCRKLRSKDLSDFRKGLPSRQLRKTHKIKIFDMSGNVNVGEDGYKNLGGILGDCHCSVLMISACQPSAKEMFALLMSLENTEMDQLDVSGNDKLGTVEYSILGKIVVKSGVNYLNIAKCQPSLEALENILQSLGRTKVSRLDASRNDRIRGVTFGALGSFVHQCKTQVLSIAFCKPSIKASSGFLKNLKTARLHTVDMRGNRDVRVNGKSFIGYLVRYHGMQNLKLSIMAEDLQSVDFALLKRTLDGRKLDVLDLSIASGSTGYISLVDETHGIMSSVANFLPFASKKIKLIGWELDQDCMSYLQYQLRLLFPTDLEILHGPRGSVRILRSTELRKDEVRETKDSEPPSEEEKTLVDPGPSVNERFQKHEEMNRKRKLCEEFWKVCEEVTDGKLTQKRRKLSSSPGSPIEEIPQSSHDTSDICHATYDKVLNGLIREKIATKAQTIQYIDDAGGKIQLHGCSAKFPPQTLERATKVRIVVDTADDDLPEGCVSFGPALGCGASGTKLRHPVTLAIECYFVLEECAEIEVWTKKSNYGGWIRVPTIAFKTNKRKIKFKVSHFCWFRAVRRVYSSIKSIIYPATLNNYLYYNTRLGEFLALFCLDNSKIINDCTRAVEGCGYRRALPLPEVITPKHSKSLACCRLECRSNDVMVEPSTWEELDLSDFNDLKYKQFVFRLRPLPSSTRTDLIFIHKYKDSRMKRIPVTVAQDQTSNETEIDILSDVTQIDVKESSPEQFRTHREKDGIYQISENPNHKGKVLIINNEFKNKKNPRTGSEVDVKNMRELWTKMGFKVSVQSNLTAEQMSEHCENFAQNKETSCVRVLILMSHGAQNDKHQDVVKAECGRTVLIKNILGKFHSDKCQHLSGIPKIFIFQCCRGGDVDEGVLIQDESDIMTRAPTSCDTLEVYASQSGMLSYRRPTTGSWLINAITNVFQTHACDETIASLFEKVNGVVSKRLGHIEKKSKKIETKQVCVTNSTLTNKLFLFPGHPS